VTSHGNADLTRTLEYACAFRARPAAGQLSAGVSLRLFGLTSHFFALRCSRRFSFWNTATVPFPCRLSPLIALLPGYIFRGDSGTQSSIYKLVRL
jgi:hypothetical protein